MTWIFVVVCLAISFTFSGIEAGILSVNRVRLRHRMKMGDAAAKKLHALLSHRERLLVTVLLVTNLMNIIAVILTAGKMVPLLGRPMGYLLTGLLYLPVFVLGIELLPKSLFRRFPYRALAMFAGVLQVTDFLLSPVLAVGSWAAKYLRGAVPEESKLFFGREEFKYLTIESEREGGLSHHERLMIHNVVDFRSVVARDVMIPMERIQSVRSSLPIQELLFLAHRHQVEQFPVMASSGEISGVVSVFDVLLEREAHGNVSHYQRRAVTVGVTEPAYSVIRKLRAARTRMGLVMDESRGAVGVVTHEDIILRLVSTATKPPAATEPSEAAA